MGMGAQNLILTSKSGDVPKGMEDRTENLKAGGAKVTIVKCDLAQEREVEEMIETILGSFESLAAIVHTSGVMANKTIADMDQTSLRRAFDSKATGAHNLHKLTLDHNLHAFIMLSSLSALWGSAGQGNYSAANAYCDELARLRVARGLPAVSVQLPTVDMSGWTNGSDTTVSIHTFKYVLKKVMCGREPVGPVQALLTEKYLAPTAPTARSMVQPLLARAETKQQEVKQDEESGPKAPAQIKKR